MTIVERLTAALADRCSIEREIGAGGMATVYLARDGRHERRVAIKVLHPELSALLGPERFLGEIKLTACTRSIAANECNSTGPLVCSAFTPTCHSRRAPSAFVA